MKISTSRSWSLDMSFLFLQVHQRYRPCTAVLVLLELFWETTHEGIGGCGVCVKPGSEQGGVVNWKCNYQWQATLHGLSPLGSRCATKGAFCLVVRRVGLFLGMWGSNPIGVCEGAIADSKSGGMSGRNTSELSGVVLSSCMTPTASYRRSSISLLAVMNDRVKREMQ